MQDAGALLGGGAGGEDVVDKEDAAAANSVVGAEGEGAAKVAQASVAIEPGLGEGVAAAAEGVLGGDAGGAGEFDGEFAALIVTAKHFPPWVEGDGDEEPVGGEIGEVDEAFVSQGLAEEGGEEAAELKVAFVFESVDEVTNEAFGTVAGGGEVEFEVAVLAVPAAEVVGEIAGVGLSAVGTVGRFNKGKAVLAGAAQPGVEARGGWLRAIQGDVAAEAEAGEKDVERLAGVLTEPMALPDRPREGGEGGHSGWRVARITW